MSSKNLPGDDLGARLHIEFSPFSLFRLFKSVPKLVEEHLFTYNALQKQQMNVLQKSLKKTCKTPILAGNNEAPCPYFFLNSEAYEGHGGFLPKFYSDKRKVVLEVSSFTHNTAFVDSIIKSICIFQLKRRENSGFVSTLTKRLQGRKEFEYDPISLFCEEFKSWAVEFESASSKEQARQILAERLKYIERILDHVNLFEHANQTISFVGLLRTLNDTIQQQIPLYYMSIEEGLENLVKNTNCIVENSLEFVFFINLCTKKTPPKIFVVRDLLAVEPYAEYLKNTRGALLTHCFSTAQMDNLLSFDFRSGLTAREMEIFRSNMRALRKKPVTTYPIALNDKVQLFDNWWTNTDSEKVGMFSPFCTKPHMDAYLDIIASLIHISQALKVMNFIRHFPTHLKEAILSVNNFDVFLMAFRHHLQKLGQNIQFLKASAKEINMQLDTKTADLFAKNWREGLSAISSSVNKISAAFDTMKPSLIFLRDSSAFKRDQFPQYEDEQGILKAFQTILGEYIKCLPANTNHMALTYSLPALQAPVQLQRSSLTVRSLVLESTVQSSGFSYREIVGVLGAGICIDLCLDGAFAFSSSLLWSSAVALIYYFREPIGNFASLAYSNNTQPNMMPKNKPLALKDHQEEEQLSHWEIQLLQLKNKKEESYLIALRHVCLFAGLLRNSATTGPKAKQLLNDYLPDYIKRMDEDTTISPKNYLLLQLTIIHFLAKRDEYIEAVNACNNILNYQKSQTVEDYKTFKKIAENLLKQIKIKQEKLSAVAIAHSQFN